MNNKDNIIFERQIDNYRLKKVYDVTVAGSKYRDIDFSMLSKGPVEFKEEKDNEYDDKAVAVYKDNIKLGYMFRGTGLREYVRSSLISDEVYEESYLYYINSETKELRYKLAMYKKLSEDNYHYIKDYSFRLHNTDIEDRNEALWFTDEKSKVTFDISFDDDRLVTVYNDASEEIGELSLKDSEKIIELMDDESIELYSYVDEKDDNKVSVRVFVYRPEETKNDYYSDYYEYDYDDVEDLFESDHDESSMDDVWNGITNLLSRKDNKSEDVRHTEEREKTLDRLKRDYSHVFDYVDKNLNVDISAADNEFGYGNEDYEDLMDLEIELSKLKRK